MNITLELIQILDAIDRNGTFENAAVELHKVRSALSYTIRKAENSLGIKVFNRIGRRAELTPSGRLLLEQGRQLLNISDQIEQNVKREALGWESILRIAYDEIINIEPLLNLIKKFQQECPTINLEVYSEVLGGCAEALIHNRADIAIGLSAPLSYRSEFVYEPLGKTNFVFAISPSHPLAKAKEPIPMEKIKLYSAIVARDSVRTIPHTTSTGLLPEQYRITFSSLELKKQAQIKGLGVGFLPYNHIKDDIEQGRLIIKQVERTQPTSICYIGWNKENAGKGFKWLVEQITDKSFKRGLLGPGLESRLK
ncbi:MAG: LysR family transcriptional regulator [Gammaproteobacteria bacterium]|nr:LysR family transcriptional regulator [Gammaproteobacteria bacterium]